MHMFTDLPGSQSCRRLNHLDALSAFRPCGRDVVEFFNNTGWAFLVNLTAPCPTNGMVRRLDPSRV
jgi:hypothetical protein